MNVDSAVIRQIDDLARKRFELEVTRQKLRDEFAGEQAAMTARHAGYLAPIEEEIDRVERQLLTKIEENRPSLIAKGRQSFATMAAVFQFRRTQPKPRVTDATAALEVARRLGIVRKVGRLVHVWKLDSAKLMKWLEKNGEYRDAFDECIEPSAESAESLSLKPNGTYTVVHDGSRISPPAVTIKS